MKKQDENSRRRRVLIAMLGGVAAIAGMPRPGAAQPACVLSPRQTEGPYFLDARLDRSDIRRDTATGVVSAGTPLHLQLRVLDVDAGCKPLGQTAVEIWHCDATGAYSGVEDRHAGIVPGDFLRGYQLTDEQGRVRFTTIFPGWYPGRAVHIHVKLRPSGAIQAGGGEWTSQFYFEENATMQAHRHPAYQRSGRMRQNEEDFLYRRGGRELMLRLEKTRDGYAGSYDIGVRGAYSG